MSVHASVEFHPENGNAPFVVVVPTADGGRMWFSYETRERAEQKRPIIEREWARHDGMIELDYPTQCQRIV